MIVAKWFVTTKMMKTTNLGENVNPTTQLFSKGAYTWLYNILIIGALQLGSTKLTSLVLNLHNVAKISFHGVSMGASSQYARQESNEVERYSKTKITAPFYDP